MYCIKFVTEDYLSPNTQYQKLNYSNFGVPIEIEDCDPKEKGQCGKGIHVIPITKNANFAGCIFDVKCIVLEVNEDDIIYQKDNGKMRVKKATPLGDFDRNHSLWNVMIKNPKFAYNYALFIDQCAREDTRNAVLSSPIYAYHYAENIDKCARDDTRNAVLKNPEYTYYYAKEVDKSPKEDTRNAVLSSPVYAYYYASDIDKCARDDTRNTAYKDFYYKKLYIKEFGE
jgi:hypothetical protein